MFAFGVKVTAARSPNLNAYAERFVKSIRSEVLNKMLFPGEGHLRKSLAISGPRIVVGATEDNDGGSAYVYDLASATPTVPVATLTNPSPAFYETFGSFVAVSGTRVVVGAPANSIGGRSTGSAYVYDLNSATPAVPVVTLNNLSPEEFEQFGTSVAISGTRVVVGAPQDNTGALNAESTYVYDLSRPTPTVPVATLNNPSPGVGDNFGNAVVGAPYDNTRAQFAGQAYVYDLASAASAVPLVTLTNPYPNAFDYFGSAVAISGTRAVVGVYRGDIGGYNAGIVYVYDLAGATPAITLTNPTTGGRGGFGVSLAVSGTRLVVGEYRSDVDSIDPGRAYVYDFASVASAGPIITLTNPSTIGHGGFGASVAISGTRVVVGAAQNAAGALLAGSAYVYDLTSATPGAPVLTLTNPEPSGAGQLRDLGGHIGHSGGDWSPHGRHRCARCRDCIHL